MIEQVREAITIHLDKDGKEITGKPVKNKTQKSGPVKDEKAEQEATPEEPAGTN